MENQEKKIVPKVKRSKPIKKDKKKDKGPKVKKVSKPHPNDLPKTSLVDKKLKFQQLKDKKKNK